MQPSDYQSLYDAARAALTNSYSPYSKFRVGAALLTETGKVFAGTNVENASYGLTICAERVAILKAVSQGERAFVAIAVASESGGACTHKTPGRRRRSRS
jgi:cytidine deaminase